MTKVDEILSYVNIYTIEKLEQVIPIYIASHTYEATKYINSNLYYAI